MLCFGDWAGSGSGGVVPATLSSIFHAADDSVSGFADENLPTTNGFCGAHAWLADGRLLLAGGTVGWPERTAASMSRTMPASTPAGSICRTKRDGSVFMTSTSSPKATPQAAAAGIRRWSRSPTVR